MADRGSNMTNEQIAQRIRELDAAIAAELGNAAGSAAPLENTEPRPDYPPKPG
jgi:hypothetical protein